jgi:voltage-gated potassium channel
LDYIREILQHPLFKIFGAIIIIALLGATFVLIFEINANKDLNSLGDAVWWVLVTMTTVGYGDRVPITPGGRVIGITVMFLGVALVSLFTATVSSIFVARQIKEGRGLEQIKLKNHLVICGWNFNGEQILNELLKHSHKKSEIVLINQLNEDAISDILNHFSSLKIKFVHGDYTKEAVLNRANIASADFAIILPDISTPLGEKSDERTILATLSIKAINPKIKVYAHILNRENLSHIKKAKADDVLLSDAYAGYIMASHILAPGIPQTIEELFSEDSKHNLIREEISQSFIGKTFAELRDFYLNEKNSIPLGIGHETEQMHVIDILSEDYSYLDEFIKRKFEQAGRGLTNEPGMKIKLNPMHDTILQEKDFIILLKTEIDFGLKNRYRRISSIFKKSIII